MRQQNIGFHQKVPKKLIHPQNHQQTNAQTEQQIEQHILSLVDSILPSSMRPVNDKYTGIDYIFEGIKIDRKFGFYFGGKDSIRVRLNKNELINKSDFTLVMHPDRIDFFPTQRIRDYLRKYPKRAERDIDQSPRRDKKTGKIVFVSARIKLSDLYAQENVKPISVSIPLYELAKNRHHLKLRDLSKLQEMVERVLKKVQKENMLEKAKKRVNPNKFYRRFISKKEMKTAKKPTNPVFQTKKYIRRR